MEHKTLDVGVDGTVHEFHRVLDKRLVLGMAHPGRIYGATVMLGERREVVVYHRLVAVAAGHRGPQVVRNDRHGDSAEETQRVLAGLYQVLLALRPNCLAVCVVAARKNGHEDLHAPCFPGRLIDHLQSVTGKVDVHLVSGIMLHMPDGCRLEHMPSQKDLEVGVPVSFGMRRRVFGVQGLHRDALALQSCGVFRKQGFQLESAR